MKIGIAASALALVLVAAPAAAEQTRTAMSVTAVVTPACSGRPGGTACSTASFSTMTAARLDERPLAEAEALLGRPVRRGRAIVFTAPVASPWAEAGIQAGPRYLTFIY